MATVSCFGGIFEAAGLVTKGTGALVSGVETGVGATVQGVGRATGSVTAGTGALIGASEQVVAANENTYASRRTKANDILKAQGTDIETSALGRLAQIQQGIQPISETGLTASADNN